MKALAVVKVEIAKCGTPCISIDRIVDSTSRAFRVYASKLFSKNKSRIRLFLVAVCRPVSENYVKIVAAHPKCNLYNGFSETRLP